MPKAPTFVPTEKRGVELLREILDRLIAEEEARKEFKLKQVDTVTPQLTKALKQTPLWNQSTWAKLFTDAVPAGTTAQLLADDEGLPGEDFLLALDQPVACGTTMCFAGHVTHAVGDRFLAEVWTGQRSDMNHKQMREQGRRLVTQIGETKNLKRMLSVMTGRQEIGVTRVLTIEGESKSIRDRAIELLGITSEEAVRLFDGVNNLETIKVVVEGIEYRVAREARRAAAKADA